MKINSSIPTAAGTAIYRPASSDSAKTEKTTSSSGTEVSLSVNAAALQDNTAPIDSSKVQEIRQAISEGRFKINPEAIADRLIDSARELINAQRVA